MTEREISLEAELKAARLEVKLLKGKVDALVRMLYGKKSEKFDSNQLMLLESFESKKEEAPASNDPAEVGAENRKRAVRNKPTRSRIPDDLPVYEEVLDPEEVKAAPQQQYRQIGEEVSEQLDFRPAQFLKRRLIRRKYASIAHAYAPPVIAPLPASLQERCLATPDLIAHVLVSKYVDHLPCTDKSRFSQCVTAWRSRAKHSAAGLA